MSALPPKADMCGATMDVRFGPIVDIGTFSLGHLCSKIVPTRNLSASADHSNSFTVSDWMPQKDLFPTCRFY
jgi:hypothetical protein